MRDKRRLLLLRLYNEPGAGYVKGTHEPIDDSVSFIDAITSTAKGNRGDAPLLSRVNLYPAWGGDDGVGPGKGNLRLIPNERYTYLIGVSKSLTGFTSAIVELNYELRKNIDYMRGIQRPIISAPASVAGTDTEPGTEPEPEPSDITEGETAGLVVAGGVVGAAVIAFLGR